MSRAMSALASPGKASRMRRRLCRSTANASPSVATHASSAADAGVAASSVRIQVSSAREVGLGRSAGDRGGDVGNKLAHRVDRAEARECRHRLAERDEQFGLVQAVAVIALGRVNRDPGRILGVVAGARLGERRVYLQRERLRRREHLK
jgi:tetrahydromethanopterin S-methyltransferase subunit G